MNEMNTADVRAQQDATALKQRINKADPETLALLLTEARSHYGWRDKEVSDTQLREIYDIAKNTWATSSKKFRKRAYHTINYYNNTLYVLGGKSLSVSKRT
ncbi:MAG: hypothetical protein JKX94_05030, partial [Sneathiella sp.]|nr:hypothetical protein [Sneathiella sp.]